MTVVGSSPQSRSATRQIRRAWLVIVAAGTIFGIFVLALILGSLFIYQHATVAQTATLEFVHGNGVLWRSGTDADWQLVDGSVDVHEGDQISTTLGTFAILTMFDGTTVEVAEDSVVQLEKMRASRFTHRTKLIKIEPLSGSVYVNMVPRENYGYSEVVVNAENVSTVMADGSDQQQSGTFLVELVPTGDLNSEQLNLQSVRVANIVGTLRVQTTGNTALLESDQQLTILPNGNISEVTDPVREVVTNGSFEFGLAGWNVFWEPSTEDLVESRLIQIVNYSEVNTVDEAVQFSYRSVDDPIKAGIEQKIGQTLRGVSKLTFSLEVKMLDDQLSEENIENREFPLTIELHYLDKQDTEQTLRRSYYAGTSARNNISHAIASPLTKNVWELVVFELDNLRPLPTQLASIVLYASGSNFQIQVANVSLTSSELTPNNR